MRAFLLLCALRATQGFHCGTGDPQHTPHIEHVIAPQVYHDAPARGLQTAQTYTAPYVSVKAANASGLTKPIRIQLVWDVINTPGADAGTPGTCSALNSGACAKQCYAQSSTTLIQVSGSPSTADCSKASTVVAPGNDIYKAMLARTAEATKFWTSALSVKPVQNSITIQSSSIMPTAVIGKVYNDADLVIVMVARPSPNSPIAGYAQCSQYDQYHRCTVGIFNWVPEIITTGAAASTDDVKESELHTALHEIVHLLGGITPGTTNAMNFIDSNGAFLDATKVFTVETDPAYKDRTSSQKMRTLITTPNVAKFTQTYYGCATAKGFPLEDLELGKGVHWEARVAGPELMSYGSNSGQVFISDITMGYLEDTGYYVVDYTKAGSIVTPTTDDTLSIGTPTQMSNVGTASVAAPAVLPVGFQRWGLNGGCAFIDGDPRTSIPAPYTCASGSATSDTKYTCTSDNRMSAVCSIPATWNTIATSSMASYGKYDKDTGVAVSTISSVDVGTTPNSIPLWQQYFKTDAAAQAASGISTATTYNTGGYNNAMDYMPVPVGYWNCAYQTTGSASNVSDGTSVASLYSSFTSGATDMTKFGGQSRCPSCRCLSSSLMQMSTLSVNTAFPKYGLCYRTNCATYNYLQVGIKGQLDGKTYWYPCPSTGGKLYIPGFSGALHCPVASTFCQMETISGILYAEQNALYEAIFWGTIIGTLVICFFVCSCKCLRDRAINCSKTLCGARSFEPPGGHGPVDEDDKSAIHLPPVSARILLAVNAITFLAGVAIVATLSYMVSKTNSLINAALNPLGLGMMIILLSFAGIKSARARSVHGPSCWLLLYFFINLAVSALIVFFIAYVTAYATWSTYIASSYNLVVASGFVTVPANVTYAQGVALATATVQSNINYLMALAGCVLFVFLITLFVSARIMTVRVLVSILLTFVNNILLGFGALFLAVGIYIAATNSASLAGLTQICGYVTGLGLCYMLVSALGHGGVHYKSFPLMTAFIVLALGLLVCSIVAVWVCFNRADSVLAWVLSQSDATLASIADSLKTPMNKSDLVLKMQNNLQMLGLGFAVMLVFQVAAIVTAVLFLHFVRQWRLENGLTGDKSAIAASTATAGADDDAGSVSSASSVSSVEDEPGAKV